MSAVQPHLFPLATQPRLRSVRRPFRPSPDTGPYRLPHDVRDRLGTDLAGYRNRDAAFAMAVFLGRFWSAPGRIERAFPIDRRGLANRPDLGLTEAKVRGAVRTLEKVGFLDRIEPDRGSRYQRTSEGDLHRKPVPFRLGLDYRASFEMANKRAQKGRERRGQERRLIIPRNGPRSSMARPAARVLKSPKSISEARNKVIMGEIRRLPEPRSPNPQLEAALERWRRTAEEQGLLGSGPSDS
jgi:hypothetical protein